MKKFLSLALVMIMLVTTLVSCSLLEKIFPKDEEKPLDTDDRIVTEEEWNANFAYTNFEFLVTSSAVKDYYMRVQVTENGYCMTESSREEPLFVIRFMNAWYELKSEGDDYVGVYYGTDPQEAVTLSCVWLGIDELCLTKTSSLTFSEWTFDESKGAYVYTEIAQGETFDIEVYFENGILTKINNMNNGVSMLITFSNLGTTKVEFPEFTFFE